MSEYAAFLQTKRKEWTGCGFEVASTSFPDSMFPFQAALTMWALRKGRAALWADTGLGKTVMALTWSTHIPGRTLIIAPLCVAPQTIAEARKFDLPLPGPLNSGDRVEITNYERLHHVRPEQYQAVVLDESSILKALDGKTRTRLIAMFQGTTYRLCCTATPAPNDAAELGNHAEFLGVSTRAEMLATFFVHVEDKRTKSQVWRLKGHGRQAFYDWLATWGMFLQRPSDLGFSNNGYRLPPLRARPLIVRGIGRSSDYLFPDMGYAGIGGRIRARQSSISERLLATERLVRGDQDQWIIWCGLNDEQRQIAARLGPECVSVEGADDAEEKEARLWRFMRGEIRVLVSKPRIAGFGLNLQGCSNMIFLGLSDSFESYYQAIRRIWRYGQLRPVNVWIVISEAERAIMDNVQRKEREHADLARALIRHMRDKEREEIGVLRRREDYAPTIPIEVPSWLGA